MPSAEEADVKSTLCIISAYRPDLMDHAVRAFGADDADSPRPQPFDQPRDIGLIGGKRREIDQHRPALKE